jgi:MFS superfamily sulfate permease-like transporter
MSALPQLREHRYTIEEFEEMNFGDLAAELIDGLVVVAKALPSASSTCWAVAEGCTSLAANRGAAGYAACLMPQTSCHAWKARVRSAR